MVDLFNLPDTAFKLHTRFSKLSVRRIAHFLRADLVRPNNRGLPLSPENQVAVALLQLSGGQFQRINGLAAGGLSQNASRENTLRVVNALIKHKEEWVRFPTPREQMVVAQRLYERFKLPGFVGGVDGCQIRWQKKIRGLRRGVDPQFYWCRKQFYSVNAQFVGSDELIFDYDIGFSGSTHDSRVWRGSQAKIWIESTVYKLAGDSAYPLSEHLVRPYDAPGNITGPFNKSLTGLRTVCTENPYGRIKQRFPCLREMRMHLIPGQKVIAACVILFNMAFWIEDEMPAEVDLTDPHQRPLPGADKARKK